MSKLSWIVQSFIWRRVVGITPTCFLQWELNGRLGVTTHTLTLNEKRTISACGPCTITFNYD